MIQTQECSKDLHQFYIGIFRKIVLQPGAKYYMMFHYRLPKILFQCLSAFGNLIKMKDVIIMQAGNISEINKHAGCNKPVRVGILQKLIMCATLLLDTLE